MNDINLFERVSFNPIVKTYIFVYVAFTLFCTIIGIPLMVIWLCGFGQWYSRHYYEKLECELKERALRFQKGIILNIEKTIPLEYTGPDIYRGTAFEKIQFKYSES
ncbi:MAG: hypothetical protein LH629_16765 [Ignavibacteria bacterium]|nr:hypothetical protein [Ignavibacteria bacterium]